MPLATKASLVQFRVEGSEGISLSYMVAIVPGLKSGLSHCGAHSVSSYVLLLSVNRFGAVQGKANDIICHV